MNSRRLFEKIILFPFSVLKAKTLCLVMAFVCIASSATMFLPVYAADPDVTAPIDLDVPAAIDLSEPTGDGGGFGTPEGRKFRHWLFTLSTTGGVMLFARSHGAGTPELVWLLTALPPVMSDALAADRALDQSEPGKQDLPSVFEALKQTTFVDVVLSLIRGSAIGGAVTFTLIKKGYPPELAWQGAIMPFVQSGIILGLGHVHYNAWVNFNRWFGLVKDFRAENKAPKLGPTIKENLTQNLWLLGYHGGLAFLFENEPSPSWDILLDAGIGSFSQGRHVITISRLTTMAMLYREELAKELSLSVEATERALYVLSRAYAALVSIICSSGVVISSSGFRKVGGTISGIMAITGFYLERRTAEGKVKELFTKNRRLFRRVFKVTNAGLNLVSRCGQAIRGLTGFARKIDPPVAD